MWVMPISTFVDLDRLQPHQLLKEAGKIVLFDKSMLNVFFLSHQCVVVVFGAPLEFATDSDAPLPSSCLAGGQGFTTLIKPLNSCGQCSGSFSE